MNRNGSDGAVTRWWRGLRSRLRRERKPSPQMRPPQARVLRGARWLALAAIAALVAAASLVSFAESYRALYEWAREHGLSAHWSAVWPLQIDVFIAVGELALFIALLDSWQRRSRILPWVVTLGGLAVSVAGNVGHVGWLAPVADKATAAVPPLAAAAALAVGLGVLKRVVENWQPDLDPKPEPATPRATAWRPDPLRKISADEHVAPKTAQLVQRRERAAVKAAFNGHGGAPHE